MITKEMTKRLLTQKKLREHVGCRYFKKHLLVIKGSHSIFYKNYYDWRKVCKEYRDVDDAVRFNDAWRWRKQKAIIRSFHNLIVAFRSYLEHIKGFVKKEHTSDEFREYIGGQLSVFENDELTNFVVVLRDMMVHRQIYPLVSKGILKDNHKNREKDMYHFQSINREKVEEYVNSSIRDKIKKEIVTTFLQAQPQDIDIESILDQYFIGINTLHREIIFGYISAFKDALMVFSDVAAVHLKDFNDNDPINRLQLRYLQFMLHNHERFCQSTSTDKS